jgi:2-iminobutanoate/2-iminopropanoate deaminase
MSQPKKVIRTDQAPKAIGPYSQGIVTEANRLLFTAGQVPLDPATGKLVEGDIATQTRRVLENIRAVLEEAGSGLEYVVKTTVFLVDLNDFAAMNEVYASYFSGEPPARSTVQVAKLPAGARVEIETVAVVP